MPENRDMTIKQEVFDEMINSATALTKQIFAKRDNPHATITQEEADFANAFLTYAHELNEKLQERYGDELLEEGK